MNDTKTDATQLLENWERAVNLEHEKHKDTHKRKEFTFSLTELRQLIKLFTIQTLAQQGIDDKLNNDVLARIGIAPNNKVKILYDLSVGRLAVWLPKEDIKEEPLKN